MPIVDLASFDSAQGVCWLRWDFPVPPGPVWDCLTDPAWLRTWLGTPLGAFGRGETPGPGAVVEIDHGDALLPGRALQRSRIKVCRAPELLEITWDFPGEAQSLVEVRLAGQEGGSRLTLTHTGLGSAARDYAIGWHAHLIFLAAAVTAAPMDLADFPEVYERVSRAYYAR